MVQQVVKDQQQAGEVEGHSLQLRVSALCHFSDGLGDLSEHGPPATFRQVVEEKHQELEMLHVEVILPMNRTLDSVLF